MFKLKKPSPKTPLVFLIAAFFLSNCIDPVAPEFEFDTGYIYVEGLASTIPRASLVTISESVIEFGVYGASFVEGAMVTFINTDTNEEVQLQEEIGVYVPPSDFVVAVGESWKLLILLENGATYESTPETVLEPVEITQIEAEYDPKLIFKETSGSVNKHIPGHSIAISFDDPAAADNYYLWSFRSFENLDICEKCWAGTFREGECKDRIYLTGDPYFDYPCETNDCWKIRQPEAINIYDDEFCNGKTISNLEVAKLPLHTKENMVVEVQQISISPDAYEYYKVLKDLLENTSSINAPPPAALIGNMSNPSNSENFVFGRFTVAGTFAKSVYMKRSDIIENQLETVYPLNLEDCQVCPGGCNDDCLPMQSTPCAENRYRTAIIPSGWIEN
ncbi:MAG: hypothetical protein COA50_03255 [Flavobacteriaceae bacterium]|nr:MAG: hypothetical protein COA50_03255 [Flavobacteriaceae bacterium]